MTNHWQNYADAVESKNIRKMQELAEDSDTPLFYRIRLAKDIMARASFDNADEAYNLYLWAYDQWHKALRGWSGQLEVAMFLLADSAQSQWLEMRYLAEGV